MRPRTLFCRRPRDRPRSPAAERRLVGRRADRHRSLGAPAAAGGMSAAYFTRRQPGRRQPTPSCRRRARRRASAMVHQTSSMARGRPAMRPVDRVELPAGETVDFKPGSYHVMLMGLSKDLPAGRRSNSTSSSSTPAGRGQGGRPTGLIMAEPPTVPERPRDPSGPLDIALLDGRGGLGRSRRGRGRRHGGAAGRFERRNGCRAGTGATSDRRRRSSTSPPTSMRPRGLRLRSG